jgi:fumarate hydratase class II
MPKKLYGSSTEKALKNFPISGWPMPRAFIKALALIKEHAARVNGQLKQIPAGHAVAIAKAAASIASGKHQNQFPVDVFQTGSGTSSNMNMNEVIATIASGNAGSRTRSTKKVIHPNDHVNCSQSSNDVVPTAMQLACALQARDELIPALMHLQKTLQTKGKQFHSIIKTARTHMMDAVPVRLGDEFLSYAALVDQSVLSVDASIKRLCELPLGGTAAGTGLNAHAQFTKKVIARLKSETKLPLKEASNHIAAQSCPLAAQAFSSALSEVAIVLTKIGNDIRLMGSGPTAGLNELQLPELQAGSSIMPGKVNPVLCESVEQVGAWVLAGDSMVHQCLAQGSRFELNTCYPIIACKLLTSTMLLTNVSNAFANKCVKGIKANTKVIKHQLDRNAMLVTALTKEIGYDEAAKIAKEAMQKGEAIISVAGKRTKISKAKLKGLLDPKRMV